MSTDFNIFIHFMILGILAGTLWGYCLYKMWQPHIKDRERRWKELHKKEEELKQRINRRRL